MGLGHHAKVISVWVNSSNKKGKRQVAGRPHEISQSLALWYVGKG